MTGYNIPDRLARDIEALLNADPYNADIHVVRVEPWDTAQSILEKVAALKLKGGKRGAALLVLPVSEADDDSENLDLAVMTYSIAVQAYTVRELNQQDAGTKKSAHQIIRRAAEWLKPIRLEGILTDFVPGQPFINQVRDKEAAKLDIWQLNLRASEADGEEIQRVATVAISTAGALPALTVTLACATAGASIYYSLDGSMPLAGAGTLYAAPFILDAAATVRAVAYKAGLFPQQVSSRDIS